MNVTIIRHDVTKDQAAKILGLKVYDTALPQSWLDATVKNLNEDYHKVLSSFVWCYDGGSFCGYPYPLTVEAYGYLKALDQHLGNSFSDESKHAYNVLSIQS